MEMASELSRLRATELEQRVAFEEKVDQVEQQVKLDDRVKNDHVIGIVDQNLRDCEKVADALQRRVEQQSADIQNKKLKLYEHIRELETQLRENEEGISERRLILAKSQEDNEKIGHVIRIKSDQSDRLNDEIRDMKNTAMKLGDLERQRKEDLRLKVERFKEVT